MKKKLVIIPAGTACLVGALIVVWQLRGHSATSPEGYLAARVERGEIVNTITSSGTIQPVSTVNVGTQVSGIIDKVYADFNDTVTKGQLIAELDRTLLAGALDEASAARDRAKAQYELALAEYQRNEPLYAKGFIAEQELTSLHADLLVQEATLKSAEATVKKARMNLQYATIRSPITGTVIQRNIEAGQTVAANFSAPTLFVIAEDLRRMQIIASVDEADIGAIRHGQEVRFTVQAFPDRTYPGIVQQIRLQPTTTQNVVTYSVVIAAENGDGSLMPGMTATIDFIIGKATDVLLVPNAALRFRPGRDSSQTRKFPPGSGITTGAFNRNRVPGPGAAGEWKPPVEGKFGTGNGITGAPGEQRSVVWILPDSGKPQPVRIKTGITDGKMTEVVEADRPMENMMVITGIQESPKKKVKSVSILPQPGPPGRRH